MNIEWILVKSIPAQGKTFIYEDAAPWSEALAERSVPGALSGPIRAEVFVSPQEDGALFRGRVTGTMVVPCNRCQEDCEVSVNETFDSYEPYPSEPVAHKPKRVRFEAARSSKAAGSAELDDDQAVEVDKEVVRLNPLGKGVEVNPAALALEEFILGLPLKPLCDDECQGLCPSCGCNKNTASCDCADEREDPRLAPLKKLSFDKK